MDRYSRQILFSPIGQAGQDRLGRARAVIAGCGALGTVIATGLVRAGIGHVRIIDRDLIELHNLQRQILFDEDDVAARLPKAIAAQRHLARVNSAIEIEGVVSDLNHTNAEALLGDADVILDGLDNFETRFLVNDVALKLGIPWVYGGAVSSHGSQMNILPGETACFRCLVGEVPPGGASATCDTVGVIAPAPMIVGALQIAEALKILTDRDAASREVAFFDVWDGTWTRTHVKPREDCPSCMGRYDFLEGDVALRASTLCGQGSVQVLPPRPQTLSLDEVARRLVRVGEVEVDEYMLRFHNDECEFVLFPDARAIVMGTDDQAFARGIYARYVGS
ncbi:MAG: ThiF family adenylyltransferase [Pseudomonadota bacterium]